MNKTHINNFYLNHLLILSLFLCTSSFAQIAEVNLFTNTKDVKYIDKTIERYLKSAKLPGITFVLANKGRIVYSKSYGYAQVERKIPLKPLHRMKVAGCTKIITASLIMRLIQEGKLSLEDKVFGPNSIFKQEFPVANKAMEPILVRHLLEQTCGKGWSDFATKDPDDYLRGNNHFNSMRTALSNLKEYSKPGKMVYRSSFSYFILGRIIEKISGKTYLEYLKDTFKDVAKNELSLAHESNDKDLAIHYNDSRKASRFYAAASNDSSWGLIASPVDFMNILLAIDGNPAQKDVLINASVKILKAPSSTNKYYGKGWNVSEEGDYFYDWNSHQSSIAFNMKQDGITWVLVTNGNSKKGGFAKSFFKLPEDLIKKLKSIP